MIDYFNGDPYPEDYLINPDVGSLSKNHIHPFTCLQCKFDRDGWKKRHSVEASWPAVRDVMEILKEKGITGFGAVGFCFGGSFFKGYLTNEFLQG